MPNTTTAWPRSAKEELRDQIEAARQRQRRSEGKEVSRETQIAEIRRELAELELQEKETER